MQIDIVTMICPTNVGVVYTHFQWGTTTESMLIFFYVGDNCRSYHNRHRIGPVWPQGWFQTFLAAFGGLCIALFTLKKTTYLVKKTRTLKDAEKTSETLWGWPQGLLFDHEWHNTYFWDLPTSSLLSYCCLFSQYKSLWGWPGHSTAYHHSTLALHLVHRYILI